MTSVLGKDANGVSITIDKAERREGLYIQGSTGTGKSTMLLNLILDDITDGTGVCLLDPHRDLTNRVLECMNPSRYEDVILLDLAGDYPFGLNLYECADPTDYKQVQYTIERIMHIWDRLFNISRLTPQMVEYMRNCAYTIVSNPGYTMAEIPFLFSDKKFRYKLLTNVKNVYVKQFWQDYENMPNLDRSRETSAIRNKLSEFLQDFTVPIVGQTKSTLDMRTIMDATPGKILLCKLDPNLESVTSLIGSTIIALIRNAAFSREDIPIRRRKPFNIYLEEGDRFATLDTKSLMDEGRKYGTTVTFTLQTRDKLHREVPQLVRSTLQGNVVAFRLTAPDSEEVAGVFDSTPPVSKETRREAVLVVKQNVVDHLLNQGHPNPDVSDFVIKYLQEIKRATKEKTEYGSTYEHDLIRYYPKVYFQHNSYLDKYEYSELMIAEAMQTLNNLLYKAMVHGEYMTGWDTDITEMQEDIIRQVSSLFGFSHYYLHERRDLTLMWEYTREAQQRIKAIQPKLQQNAIESIIADELWLEGMGVKTDAFIKKHLDGVAITTEPVAKKIRAWATETYEEEKFRYDKFYTGLHFLVNDLSKEPIMTESGRYEEKPGSQQTHADKQAEIANMLTQLPNMTAYVRVAGQEHTITVKHAQPDGKRSPLNNVIQTITEWNLEDRYIRDRDEVEDEIEARHHVDDDPPPPPGGSGGGGADPKQHDNGSTPLVNRPPTPLPTPRKRKLDS